MVLFHTKSGNHGQEDLFPGAGGFLESSHFIPVIHCHGFVYGDFGAIEFDFANIDHMVVAIDQQVELDAFFLLCSFFEK